MAPYRKRPDGLFSRPELKQRGWTDSLIERYLGEHDWENLNPMFKKAAPMRY